MTDQKDERQHEASDGKQGMLEAFGVRVSRDMGIYVIGAVITFFLALVSIIVVTRFLSPAEFGELALVLVFAAFLTVFYNVGLLQGTFSSVFGSAGEEEIEDDAGEAATGTKRRTMGTGLITTAALAAMGTAAVVALAPWLAEMMLGDSDRSELIVIAAVSGAAGALWRMVSNILRMERKPKAFVALNSVRPVLVVGTVIPLVASGGGVEGAVLGTAIGSCVSVIVGGVATRRSFELRMDRDDLRMILRNGLVFVPIIISIWIAQNVDIYAVSWFAPDEEVGLYRLANRVGAFLDYFTAALFMAWSPLRRTSTFEAAIVERGKDVLGGRFLTYFAIAGLGLILLMTVAADTLVRIAPPAYAAAAPLIPLMGASFLSYGLFVAVYRVSTFPRKIVAYIAAAISSALIFLGSALVLVPWLGAYGAGASVCIGFLTATTGIAYLSQRGPTPVLIEYRRIAITFAAASACFGIARGLAPHAGSWQPLVELVAFALFPAALLMLRVVTSEDSRALRRIFREALPSRSRPAGVEERVRAMPPEAISALEMVVVQRTTVAAVADHLGTQVTETEVRLVRLLRDAGAVPPTDQDHRLAPYLFSDLPVAERDALGKALWADEVDAADLHQLERTLENLRRLPKRTWKAARRNASPDTAGRDAEPTIGSVNAQSPVMDPADPGVAEGLKRLSAQERSVLELAIRRGWSLPELALASSTAVAQTSEQLVGLLRRVAGLDSSTSLDRRIGEYLFSQEASGQRDAIRLGLPWEQIDKVELDLLERTLEDLRRLPEGSWETARSS